MSKRIKALCLIMSLLLAFSVGACNSKAKQTNVKTVSNETIGFFETGTAMNNGLRVKVTSKAGFKYVRVKSVPDQDGNYARKGDFLAIELVNVNDSLTCPLEIYVGDSMGLNLYAANATQKQYGVSINGVLSNRNVSSSCVWVGSKTGQTTLLIDYTTLCDGWSSKITDKELKDIAFVNIGFSTSYNLGQEVDIRKIYTVENKDYILDANAPAFVNSQGFTVSANEILEKGRLDTLIDFTAIEAGTDYTEVSNLECIPKESYKDGLAISLNGRERQLIIKDSLENAIEFSMDHDGNVTSADTSDKHYSKDLFAYVDLWKSSDANGIEAHTGVAAKVMSTYLGTPFRMVFTDAVDNEIYYTGIVTNKNRASYYSYVGDDGVNMGIPAYWNCLWSLKTPGTFYFPYSDLIRDDTVNNGTGSTAGSNGKLDRIGKIQLAMDTANIYAIKYSIIIGTVCDVDMGSEQIYKIFNTAEYGEEQVDIANPNNSKVVKPASEDFKNENWIYKRVTKDRLVSRSFMETKYRGDVKVLEDFNMPETIAKENSKTLALNLILAEEQTSHLDIVESGRKELGTALSWTIGDYNTERKPIASEYCSLTVAADGSCLAQKWNDMTDVKGISLYVKNTSDQVASFNVEFGQTQANGMYERWGLNTLDARVYAYDVVNDKEITLVASYGVYLPAQFEGYIRIPLSEFSNPEWNLEGDGEFAYDADLLGIYLTTLMPNNSGVTFIIDELGFYYLDFTVDSIFNDSFTMKDALNSNYFGG